jgi:RNA polymerase sigma-70 factor (ECF subfamily)
MHLQAARFPARIDEQGYPATLAEQDRTRWSRARIDDGMRWLARSAEGDDASPYHLEAGIAAVHATSPTFAGTDWTRIVALYDELVARYPSPSARLSRAVALGFRDGPHAALAALGALADDATLVELAAFHAARADAHARGGDRVAARAAYVDARTRATNAVEERYLEHRIAALTA